MVLLGDFLINYQEVNQLLIYKRGLNSIKKLHPPKEAPRMPERPDPLDFLALISSCKPWTPPGFLTTLSVRLSLQNSVISSEMEPARFQ